MNTTRAWLKAVEDYHNREPVEPIIEKTLRAIVQWNDDGMSPGEIQRKLRSRLFAVEMDKITVKLICKRKQELKA